MGHWHWAYRNRPANTGDARPHSRHGGKAFWRCPGQRHTYSLRGQCKPSNAAELFAQPDVDGGLIGGASLKASDFIAIAQGFKE